MSVNALKDVNQTVLQFFENNNISDNSLVQLWMSDQVQDTLKGNLRNVVVEKRPPSGYLLFCAAHRENVKTTLTQELGTTPKPTQVTQRLSLEWKNLKADPQRKDELDHYYGEAKKHRTGKARTLAENRPKRAKSSYLYFCTEQREQVRQELLTLNGEDPKATLITKELGLRWNKLKLLGQTIKYEKLAQEDKKRYFEEKDKTQPPTTKPVRARKTDGVKSKPKTKTVVDKTVVDKTVVDKTVVDKTVVDKTVVDKSAAKSAAKSGDKSGDKSAGKTKNNYQNFCTARRPALKNLHPKQKALDITKLLAKEWKALSPVEQSQY